MKRLMTSAATVLVMSTAAWAQTDGGAFTQYEIDGAAQIYASDLLGARIYATETEVGDTMEAGAETEWDDLGEINDIVMSSDGSVEVVILGIGGFLGLGERDVAVQFDQLNVVRDGEDPTDYFLVINASQDEIENAPEFVRPSETMEGEATMENVGTDAGAEMEEAEAGETMNDAEATAEEATQDMQDAAENAEQEIEGAAAEAEAEMQGAVDEAEAEMEGSDTEAENQ